MNNKGIKQTTMYIILAIILIIALIVIFYLVENNNMSRSARPLKTSSTSASSTTKPEITNGKEDNNKHEDLVASPFSAPLSDIIYGYVFDGNYKVSINHNNVMFDFNCNNYNEAELSCTEGSGLMRYNNLIIPLYSYTGSANNVLDFAEDYYIDMKDNYIFLTNNHVGVNAGKTSIYNEYGNLIGEIENVVTGYMLNGKKYNVLYPNYESQELTFYYLNNGLIKIGYVELSDPKIISELEIVEGAILN